MLPRDSQFSTTPFVFPLFTLGLSHALSPPFIPFATFRPPPLRGTTRRWRQWWCSLSTFGSANLFIWRMRPRGVASAAGACLKANAHGAIIIVRRADRRVKLA